MRFAFIDLYFYTCSSRSYTFLRNKGRSVNHVRHVYV